MYDLGITMYQLPEDKYKQYLEVQRQCDAIIDYFLNYRGSIRQCAEQTLISKSTVHQRIHGEIRHNYDAEIYRQITDVLEYNRKYRAKPRRYW